MKIRWGEKVCSPTHRGGLMLQHQVWEYHISYKNAWLMFLAQDLCIMQWCTTVCCILKVVRYSSYKFLILKVSCQFWGSLADFSFNSFILKLRCILFNGLRSRPGLVEYMALQDSPKHNNSPTTKYLWVNNPVILTLCAFCQNLQLFEDVVIHIARGKFALKKYQYYIIINSGKHA